MPEFNPDYLSSDLDGAGLYVFSVMVVPNDAETRRKFQEALFAGAMSEALASPSRSEQAVAGPIAQFLYRAPKLEAVFTGRQMDAADRSIRFVSWALGFILRAAEHGHPELASVKAVINGASKRMARSRVAWGSPETLKAAWKEYSCVAHLWLVDRLLEKAGVNFWRTNNNKLPVFLGAAEGLRRRGEAWKHKNARAPVLDPEETWKVPNPFPLPSVFTPLGPPSDKDLQIVARRNQQG